MVDGRVHDWAGGVGTRAESVVLVAPGGLDGAVVHAVGCPLVGSRAERAVHGWSRGGVCAQGVVHRQWRRDVVCPVEGAVHGHAGSQMVVGDAGCAARRRVEGRVRGLRAGIHGIIGHAGHGVGQANLGGLVAAPVVRHGYQQQHHDDHDDNGHGRRDSRARRAAGLARAAAHHRRVAC